MPPLRHLRLLLPISLCLSLGACEIELDDNDDPDWRDLGEVPALAATQINHSPMVVVGNTVFVGTEDGIWSRSLDDDDEWTQADLDTELKVYALRVDPNNDRTLIAAGAAPEETDDPPVYRSEDGGNTWIPANTWPLRFDNFSEVFHDLVIAPDDSNRIYANLSGELIAVSTDGGLTWALAEGADEFDAGSPCILHIPESDAFTLYQGCEPATLDVVFVATYLIDPNDPFTLPERTIVVEGPEPDDLENRRPNSFASGPARPDTVYVGLEGALIAIEDLDFEYLFRASDGGDEEGDEDLPYAYIKGIWLDPDDENHLIFGGGLNNINTSLALFETRDHGDEIDTIEAPRELDDPAVEQLYPIGDNEIAVLISESDNPASTDRSLSVFVLDPTEPDLTAD